MIYQLVEKSSILIIQVIFLKGRTAKKSLKSKGTLVFSVLYHSKLNIFGLWTVGWTK